MRSAMRSASPSTRRRTTAISSASSGCSERGGDRISVLANSQALVAAWLPGSEGAGVTDVLFGDVAPTGKLAHSWPRSMDQVPVNVGDATYDPLFPFGFGLTY